MRVVVIGAGYVGLTTSACLATAGHHVLCVDRNASRIASLQRGECPIMEAGLDDMIVNDYLSFATDMGDLTKVNAVFIAVGTPPLEDGSADVSQVLDAARSLRGLLGEKTVIVVKSTVPVGTCREVGRVSGYLHRVLSNPEFLREGQAVSDFFNPDRVIIGSVTESAQEALIRLYRDVVESTEYIVMSLESAELTKYASNAMLAIRVSFANEIAALSEAVDADSRDVLAAVGMDKRIGHHFLQPGPGYGGSCFPKDTSALVQIGSDNDVLMYTTLAATLTNNITMRRVANKIINLCPKSVAVLGLTFKENTDDTRDSPAHSIVRYLYEARITVRATDPSGYRASDSLPVIWCDTVQDAVEGVDVVVFATNWPEYRELDFADLAARTNSATVVDLRNMLDEVVVFEAGFLDYVGVGR